jgi:hypothetical protein
MIAMCGFPPVEIDGDAVAVAQRSDRTAGRGFGSDVADHQAARGAAEPAVREQGDGRPEPLTDQSGRDAEHLAHPRSAPRSLVADDHHVAGHDAPVTNRGEGVLFPLEDARGTFVKAALVAGCLEHATLGRQVAAQHDEAARGAEWLRRRPHDALA